MWPFWCSRRPGAGEPRDLKGACIGRDRPLHFLSLLSRPPAARVDTLDREMAAALQSAFAGLRLAPAQRRTAFVSNGTAQKTAMKAKLTFQVEVSQWRRPLSGHAGLAGAARQFSGIWCPPGLHQRTPKP